MLALGISKCRATNPGAQLSRIDAQLAAGDVDNKTVPDVVPLEPLDRRVDVFHPDDLDVRDNSVLPREVQHRLALPDAAAGAAGDALPAGDEAEGGHLQGLGRRADEHHLPHRLEQLEQRRDGVPRRHRVDDAVHGGRRRLHLLGVAADQERVGAEELHGLLPLGRGRADHGDRHAEGLAELDGDVAEPAEPHDAQVLAWGVEAVLHHGAEHRDAGAEQRRGAGEGEGRRDTDGVVLADDDDVGEASLGGGAVV
ncbi:unnamed protein product [Urochloa decumbens]|uniref:Uncharacterized protein n=1 Tax=Urochloa decumbens TaxID=240449 RepID=A0ABC9FFP4_9POAL